jgi:hypothetical protein
MNNAISEALLNVVNANIGMLASDDVLVKLSAIDTLECVMDEATRYPMAQEAARRALDDYADAFV